MQLHCPSCGTLIPASDINLDRALAKCQACNAVLDLEEELRRQSKVKKTRPRIPQAPGILLEDTGQGMRLSYRWFSPLFIFLAFFCFAWDSFLVFWYSIVFFANGPWIWIMAAFPVLHLAVGVGLTYYTLAGFLNSTVLDVGQEELRVRHGPLPWRGNRTLPTQNIEQLYCQKKFTQTNENQSCWYSVHAVLKGGRQVPLLTGLQDRERALFIEQIVEEYLGLEDQPVGGELPRQ